MAYNPKKGDILHIALDPAAGHEMKGYHFALVISGDVFNKLGLAVICPISQGVANVARSYGTVVTLMGSGTETQGLIHCHQVKSLDWISRKARFKEVAPDFIVDDVIARVQAIIEG